MQFLTLPLFLRNIKQPSTASKTPVASEAAPADVEMPDSPTAMPITKPDTRDTYTSVEPPVTTSSRSAKNAAIPSALSKIAPNLVAKSASLGEEPEENQAKKAKKDDSASSKKTQAAAEAAKKLVEADVAKAKDSDATRAKQLQKETVVSKKQETTRTVDHAPKKASDSLASKKIDADKEKENASLSKRKKTVEDSDIEVREPLKQVFSKSAVVDTSREVEALSDANTQECGCRLFYFCSILLPSYHKQPSGQTRMTTARC